MSSIRDVSPVGTSRFERPYTPPRSIFSHSNPSSVKGSEEMDLSPAERRALRQHAFNPKAFDKYLSDGGLHQAGKESTSTTASSTDNTRHTASTNITCPDEPSAAEELAAVTNEKFFHQSHDYKQIPYEEFAINRGREANRTACVLPPADDLDFFFERFHSEHDVSFDVGDDCPDRATLATAAQIPVFDANGQSVPFGDLVPTQTAKTERQFIIFIRHFYCGACQAFLKALTDGISMSEYFGMSVPTSFIVIGCGAPDLITYYKRVTECPFPIYADSSRKLFKALGMSTTLNFGMKRPEYMKDISTLGWAGGQVADVTKAVRDPEGIRKRDVIRGGNAFQIGGEFLFENGQVVWCHRMKHMRNHTEVRVVRQLLDLDD